jgi:hypothetical protein
VRRRLAPLRPPAPLAVLLAVTALGSLAWGLITPPLQGPDEDAHFAYTQRMIETGALPQRVEEGQQGLSSEVRLAQKWGLFAVTRNNPHVRPGTSQVERRAYDAELSRLPDEGRSDGTGFQPAANNPPLYYLYEMVPYAVGYPGDLSTRLQLMRLGGLPLILLIVAVTWALCAELLPRPPWARAVAAGAVAVHPVLSFASGVVNPDIALAAVWTAFLLVAVRMVRHGPTLRRALMIGLLCAAGALLQPRGATIGLPAAVAVGLAFLRHRPAPRDMVRLAAASLGVGLVGVGIYVWLVLGYGGEATSRQLEGTVASGFSLPQFVEYVWQFYFLKLRFMEDMIGPPRGFRYVYVESFFAVFGSLDVFFPEWVYPALHRLSLYSLAVFATCVALRSAALRRHWRELTVLGVTALTLVATMHYGAYRALLGNGGADPVLVGRYLLPLVALFGLAVAFTASSLPGRWGRYLGVAVVAIGVILQVWGLAVGAERWYA